MRGSGEWSHSAAVRQREDDSQVLLTRRYICAADEGSNFCRDPLRVCARLTALPGAWQEVRTRCAHLAILTRWVEGHIAGLED